MKGKFLILIALIFTISNLRAQENPPKTSNFKYNNNFDLSFSGGSSQLASTLSWVHLYPVNKKKSFKIGFGTRFTSQFGKNGYYETAPAKLTSKETGPQVLFTEIFKENIDSIKFASTQVNSLNLSINIQYTLKDKIDIGFNIDAIGFSFGKKVKGEYIAYQSSANNTIQSAKPTPFNLLLVSDNDLGSLNSEIFIRYWLNPKWAIRAGASFLFTEYTTDNKLRLENDRWRNKALLGMIGVTYSPFK